MVKAGLLGPESRVELIDGEILEMSPQDPKHSQGYSRAERAIRSRLPEGLWLRTQQPLSLGQTSDPEPDLAVIRGSVDDPGRETAHPSSALLVVEISSTSLSFDRGVKADLYAAAGIPAYWIVNVSQRQVEAFGEPAESPGTRFGQRYQTRRILRLGDVVACPWSPEDLIPVSEFFPPTSKRGTQ